MPEKRTHQGEDENGDTKRVRSNQGSPMPAKTSEPSDDGAKKEEVAARIAAIKARMAASRTNGAPPAPVAVTATTAPTTPASAEDGLSEADARRAEAQRKIAAIKARMAGKSTEAATSPVNGGPGAAPAAQQPLDLQARIAEAKAKAAAIAEQQRARTASTTPAVVVEVPAKRDRPTGKGGLAIGLHPSMLGESAITTSKDKSRFASARGNQQPAKPRVNPYLSVDAPEVVTPGAAQPTNTRTTVRRARPIQFHEKGKWIAVANHLREQEELEAMKRRIAADARKVEIEEAGDKALLVPQPPAVEWWDEGMLPSGQESYDDWDQAGRNRIETEDSIITTLIQHPVMLAPPQDKLKPAPKPLMLTQTEQAKLRRQRRMADMKEEQAKIRLGLIEPPPPKVKKSNMMRVLGEQAVKDPTAVEARVNREIAERAYNHERANMERQLTAEQRHEKLAANQAADAAKGIRVVAFKVDNLSSGKHRYQVDKNAKEHALTGIVVLNPTMNLIVVEGGEYSIKKYKKLMLGRIKWTENAAPLGDTQATTFTGNTDGSNADASTGSKGVGSKAAVWCGAYDADGHLKDLSENRCQLIWEGEAPSRLFWRWGSKACETDGEARDVLRRYKMENMWTLARSKD